MYLITNHRIEYLFSSQSSELLGVDTSTVDVWACLMRLMRSEDDG